jgi:hypothetical protein
MDFLYPRLPGFKPMFEPNVAEASADQDSAEQFAQALRASVVKPIRDAFAADPTKATGHTTLKHKDN